VVEPPLRNLEGNPRRGVPTMGETEQEGVLVSANNRKACLSLRTPMAYSASTATSAPLQDVFVLEHTKRECMKKNCPKKKEINLMK